MRPAPFNPATLVKRNAPVNIGRRIPLGFVSGPGGLTVQPTELISARMPEPMQWVVTLMQPTKGATTTPWVSTFDGGAFPPIPPALFTAPQLPIASLMTVTLRWGAGGIAFDTVFDYPAMGGTFGITCDTMDVNIGFRGPAPVYGAVDDIPVVGAFMVPGNHADPTPLRWREIGDAGTYATSIVNFGTAAWALKPYARRVRITTDAAGQWGIIWMDSAGATVWTEQFLGVAAVGDARTVLFPASATVMTIVNASGAAAIFAIEWEIGLT